MSYSYKCYSDTKDFMKKFVNAEEGAIIYGISKSRIIVIEREAGAVYKVGRQWKKTGIRKIGRWIFRICHG